MHNDPVTVAGIDFDEDREFIHVFILEGNKNAIATDTTKNDPAVAGGAPILKIDAMR